MPSRPCVYGHAGWFEEALELIKNLKKASENPDSGGLFSIY
ncbi:hypothetical protein EY643_14710 [Halioglobus maricola]|uniref:Uncharacterized protein n=1 Tax=Halioglobus maricola TaxID=2601894 RepID=A0A5P9NLV8_9GAMM|nr:hypothetical protein EY643_14710 [Halioglobus maricola]